ncbi:sensor histidine kinase [Vallitalea okinawensis]|uniref:sensor histidine kinase n=1 Tax=Vallitalea okinawensis TaxID=2078660 RepID=UPI000CFCDACC|nr:sensor histidine kinase [Vallitalea okinawensis]
MRKTLYNLEMCRYIWLIGSIIGTLLHISSSLYLAFIFLSLVIFINSQVRLKILKNRLFLISIFLEVLLVLYLQSLTGGYIYIILFTTITDSVLRLKDEVYLIFVLIASTLLYSLYPVYSLEWIIIILLFYLITYLLLRQLRQELDARMDTEVLYDQIRKYNYELEATRARLLSYTKQVENVAQLEERNRISRELHDSIGHDLTGILLQVDASIQLLPIDGEKGMEILNSAYDNINKSIENVRQTAGKLRPTTFQSHMTTLKELIEKFERDTGVNVEFLTKGTPYQLYPSIELVIYKNIREALTNSVRHGYAKNIHIQLIYSSQDMQIIIEDDGLGSTHIQKGFGLSGMEERLEIVEGSITYAGDKGFRIHMKIPKREVM